MHLTSKVKSSGRFESTLPTEVKKTVHLRVGVKEDTLTSYKKLKKFLGVLKAFTYRVAEKKADANPRLKNGRQVWSAAHWSLSPPEVLKV